MKKNYHKRISLTGLCGMGIVAVLGAGFFRVTAREALRGGSAVGFGGVSGRDM